MNDDNDASSVTPIRRSVLESEVEHLSEIKNEIFSLYAEILGLERDCETVYGDTRLAYLTVIKDKAWRANRLVWSFQKETVDRFGCLGSKMTHLPVHLPVETNSP